jgi:predicted HicB family RNase H-like nuclease
MAYDEKAKYRTMRYMKDKRDRIVIGTAKGEKERYRQHAEAQGESLNAFAIRAMNETSENDNRKEPT